MKKIVWMVCVGFAVCAAQGVLLTEDFESYTLGTSVDGLNGWVVSGTSTLQNVEVLAGGAAGFSGGNQALYYSDLDTDPAFGSVRVKNTFSETITAGVISWYFKVDANPRQRPSFTIRDGANTIGILINMMDETYKIRNFGSGGYEYVSDDVLSLDTWYQVQITVTDVTTGTFDMRLLVADGGSGTQVFNITGLSFMNSIADMAAVDSGMHVGAGYSGTRYWLDDISVGPPPFANIEEGFESYTLGTSVDSLNGWVVSGTSTLQNVEVLAGESGFSSGSQSLYYSDLDTGSGLGSVRVKNTFSGPITAGVISWDFKIDANPLRLPSITIRNSANTVGILINMMSSSQKVRYHNGSGYVNVSGAVLSLDTWYRAEITVAAVALSTFDMRLLEADGGEGTEVFNVTGLGFMNSVADMAAFDSGMHVGAGYSGTTYWLDNLSVGTMEEERSINVAEIVGQSFVSGNLMKLVVDTPDAANLYYPRSTTNLSGAWTAAPHSDDGINAFVVTNLDYSTMEGSNETIYVETNNDSIFFHIGLQEGDIYVSPDGNDTTNSGTFEEPFATLDRARNAVRDLKAGNPDEDIVVMFRAGYYRLSETVVFGLQDSASEGHTITYSAYPGETPVFGSGIPVTGWEKTSDNLPGLPVAARGKVWQAPVPVGIDYCTSLFQSQQLLPRSRSIGFVPPSSGDKTTFHYPSGLVPADAANRGMDLRILPHFGFTMNLLPISGVNPSLSEATTSVPSTYPMERVVFGRFPEGTAWIENAVEFMDGPGQWTFDKSTRLIYLWVGEGDVPPSNIVVPKLSELLRVEGEIVYDDPADTPVTGLVFRELSFTHADHWRWQSDKTGWGLQHDWEMFDKPTAMLRFRGAEDCAVEQCEFLNSGSTAIRCDLHAQRIRIAQNHIHHIGGVGILLAGYGPGTKDVNHNNELVDNHIHDVGQDLWHAPGIFVWQSGENRVANNHVYNVPYSAIVVSGRIIWTQNEIGECGNTLRWDEIDVATGGASTNESWGQGISRSSWLTREPFLHGRHNIVEYNNVHHFQRILSDGNGIYVSGTGDANQIRHNYIHDADSPHLNAVFRCDLDQYGTVIQGNILANCTSDGIVIKGVNTVTNNIVYGLRNNTLSGAPRVLDHGHIALPYKYVTGSVIQRNIFCATEAGSPLLWENPPDALLRQCSADENLYFNSADPAWGLSHLDEQRLYGIELNSIVADPLFVNPAEGDFTLQEGSPALGFGFSPINQDLIGIPTK